MIMIESGISKPTNETSEANAIRKALKEMGKNDSFLYPKDKKGNVYYAAKTIGMAVKVYPADEETVRVWLA